MATSARLYESFRPISLLPVAQPLCGVPIHGVGYDVTPLRPCGARGQPGVAGEGVVDGVDGANAVVAGADQVPHPPASPRSTLAAAD